jgi:indoleacetamide hydrolase
MDLPPKGLAKMLYEGLTASEAASAIAAGKLGAEELAHAILGRIEGLAHLSAFTSLDPEAVLAAAQAADRKRHSDQDLGPLHGVPISFKDNINVVGHATTAGTAALRSYRPKSDAAVTAHLRQSGAIVLGKVGMHELAYGATSENPTYGTPRNPCDPNRTAGGSSGGSGTAVGAGLGPVSIGTDTGGSVRVPAALCGVWGFRPSVGRWSTDGIVPISSNRDTPGPLARSATDLALIDQCVSGLATKPRPLKGLRIGISEPFFWKDASPEIAARCHQMLQRAEAEGAVLVPLDASDLIAPHLASAMAIPLYEGRIGLEAFLAAQGLDLDYARVGDLVASPDVRAIFDAQRDPDKRVSDALYREAATQHRPALIAAGAALFARHRIDLLACPTVRFEAPLLGQSGSLRLGGQDVPIFEAVLQNTDLLSNAGFAGVSIPVGKTAAGLPIGLALDAPAGSDALVLGVAMAFEDILSSHEFSQGIADAAAAGPHGKTTLAARQAACDIK